MEENTTTSVWNKTQDEVTVADQLKVTLVVTGVLIGIAALPTVALIGYDALTTFRFNRKAKKAEKLKIVETASSN